MNDKEIQALIAYLSLAHKDEHLATVLRLKDRIARAESKNDTEYNSSLAMANAANYKRSIEIPGEVRSVKLEF